MGVRVPPPAPSSDKLGALLLGKTRFRSVLFMQIVETKNEGLSREFAITIPAGDIEDRILAKLAEIGQQVNIPGFRQGKVPTKILRQRYGQAVLGDVIQDTVVESSSKAIEDESLTPAT